MIYGTSIFNPVKRLTPGLETNARSMTAIVTCLLLLGNMERTWESELSFSVYHELVSVLTL